MAMEEIIMKIGLNQFDNNDLTI